MLARLARVPALLVTLTIILGVTHAGLAVLHMLRLAAPARKPPIAPDSVLDAIAFVDARQWAAVNIIAALCLIIGGIMRHPIPALIGCAASVACTGVWGLPLIVWSMSVAPPAPLTAPLLLIMLALPLAVLLAGVWSERD